MPTYKYKKKSETETISAVGEYIQPGLEVELGDAVQLLGLAHVTPAHVAVCRVVDPDPDMCRAGSLRKIEDKISP